MRARQEGRARSRLEPGGLELTLPEAEMPFFDFGKASVNRRELRALLGRRHRPVDPGGVDLALPVGPIPEGVSRLCPHGIVYPFTSAFCARRRYGSVGNVESGVSCIDT